MPAERLVAEGRGFDDVDGETWKGGNSTWGVTPRLAASSRRQEVAMNDPVILIGGGYAGRVAAVRLARAGAKVTLVDPRETLWEKVRLHHQAADGELPPRALAPLMASVGVDVVQGRATLVREGEVELEDGRRLPAQHIALTLGVRTAEDLPGSEHTLALDCPEHARLLHAHVERGDHVLIIGSGFTAVELAGALVAHTRVTLVGSGFTSTSALQQATGALANQGVRCVAGRVLRVSPGVAHLASGDVSANVIVRCTGNQAPPLAAASGLAVDEVGRAIAGRDLCITPWCSGAGDAISIREMPWVGTGCAVAMPMGAHLAKTVLARLNGVAPPPFTYGWGGRIIEAGSTAVFQRTTRAGHERHATTHRGWWWTKQFIVRYTTWAPEVERRTGLPTMGSLGDPPMPLLTPTAT